MDIPAENLEMLNKILELTKEKGSELILMIAPYYETEDLYIAEIMKSEHIWAENNGVKVIDYTEILRESGIDLKTDYYDSGHLDVSGAKKTSVYLAEYLLDLGLKKSPSAMDSVYKRDYDAFVKKYSDE